MLKDELNDILLEREDNESYLLNIIEKEYQRLINETYSELENEIIKQIKTNQNVNIFINGTNNIVGYFQPYFNNRNFKLKNLQKEQGFGFATIKQYIDKEFDEQYSYICWNSLLNKKVTKNFLSINKYTVFYQNLA